MLFRKFLLCELVLCVSLGLAACGQSQTPVLKLLDVEGDAILTESAGQSAEPATTATLPPTASSTLVSSTVVSPTVGSSPESSSTVVSPTVVSSPAVSTPAIRQSAGPPFLPTAPECLVPANPGDGSDFTCRAVTQALNALGLVEPAFQITNMAGVGGRIAFSFAAASRRDDDNLIVATSPATTLHLAQGRYEPMMAEDVRWLGVIGVDYGVIAVSADSPIADLSQLVETVISEPDSLRFGGGGPIGSQDHMKLGLLLKESEIELSDLIYTPFEGGGDALRALQLGYIDVFPGDGSEVMAGVESGDLRILALLTPERIAMLPDTPTAVEQGHNVQWIIFRGFYAPGDMSDEAFTWWSNALEEMAGTPEWAETRKAAGLDEFFMSGEEFGEMVQQQIQDFVELNATLNLKPEG